MEFDENSFSDKFKGGGPGKGEGIRFYYKTLPDSALEPDREALLLPLINYPLVSWSIGSAYRLACLL
jgi:hypothetical protein